MVWHWKCYLFILQKKNHVFWLKNGRNARMCACACVIFLRYSGAESTAVCLQMWKRLHTKYSAQRKRSPGFFSIFSYTFRFGCETAGDLFCQYKPGRVLINSASFIQKKKRSGYNGVPFLFWQWRRSMGTGRENKINKKDWDPVQKLETLKSLCFSTRIGHCSLEMWEKVISIVGEKEEGTMLRPVHSQGNYCTKN